MNGNFLFLKINNVFPFFGVCFYFLAGVFYLLASARNPVPGRSRRSAQAARAVIVDNNHPATW